MTDDPDPTDPTGPTEPVWMELDPGTRSLFEDWSIAKAIVESWTARQNTLAGMLVKRMGKATRGTIDGRHVLTMIPAIPAAEAAPTFDAARFHEAEPDLWLRYLTPGTGRKAVLRQPKPGKR